MCKRSRRVSSAVAAAVAVFVTLAPTAEAVPSPLVTHGYIPMRDGVTLRYSLTRPSEPGRYPVIMVYGPYHSGEITVDWYPNLLRMVGKGFAVVGVNMRGTGCSGGAIKFFDEQQGRDGYDAIEWIARQKWSNGRIGMAGASFEGISQIGVAGHRPPHLVAIAPGQIVGDIYRDVVAPGGVFQGMYVPLYPVLQAQASYPQAAAAIAAGDHTCAKNVTEQRSYMSQVAPALMWTYEDSPGARFEAWNPDRYVERIDIPVLMTRSWQDTMTGGRVSYMSERLKNLWLIQGNGAHTTLYDQPFVDRQIERFFERYLKGASNGWGLTPRIQILHETIGTKESWMTAYGSRPSPKPLSLYMHGDGQLSRTKPSIPSASSGYAYPMLSPSAPDVDLYVPQSGPMYSRRWDVAPPGGYAAFTTPALARDTEILGHGNVELWLSSTATDTDLQVTLTEVRSDGQEVYLQRGWLRASHRRENSTRSTALRPFHTHKIADAEGLEPGRPTRMRVELFPINHVFRKGSAIRMIVDAPTGTTGDWSLQFNPTPAMNTIWHDAKHPSRIVLPVVDGQAWTPMPECDTVLTEPCRPSIAPVPRGRLDPA